MPDHTKPNFSLAADLKGSAGNKDQTCGVHKAACQIRNAFKNPLSALLNESSESWITP